MTFSNLRRWLGTTLPVFALLTGIGHAGAAEEIQVTTFEYPPLTVENGTGISTRLVQAAFARVGRKVHFTYIPVKRAMETAIRGEGVYLGAPFEDAQDVNVTMAPMFDLQSTLLYLPKHHFFSKFQEPKQALRNRSIGLLRGYENNPLVMEYGLHIATPADNEVALRMLASSRFDFLPCLKMVECPLIFQKAASQGIQIAEVPFDVAPKVSLGLIYRSDNAILAHHADEFLKGVAAIRKNGTFNKVVMESVPQR
jgi:hypothetical protein